MPNKERLILGVDIRPDEIRVVEVRGSWSDPHIVRADAAPIPPGSVENGRVVSPVAVAGVLRGLVKRMGTSTRGIVMGLPARVVTARTLEIPNVPDSEMPAILEGEMAHYHSEREGESSFGYMRIGSGALVAGNRAVVMLMYTESLVAGGYREVADGAGLRLVALEPILVAQFRAANPQFGPGSVACLSIGPTRADIIISNSETIRIYRRLEIGADDLIPGRKKDVESDVSRVQQNGFPLQPDDPEPGFDGNSESLSLPPFDIPSYSSAPDVPESFGSSGAQSYVLPHAQSLTALTLEMQRSLDYFRRTFPKLDPVTKIVVATSDTELESIVGAISQELGLEITIAALPPTDPLGPLTLTGPERLKYIGAAGLAMRELPDHPAGVPRPDVSGKERADGTMKATRRKMATALATSIVLLAIGMGVAFAVGSRANNIAHELGHAQEYLADQQRILQLQSIELQAQNERLSILQSRGVPLARIMDAVTGAAAPQVGLTAVTLDAAGHIQVSGEAANERAVIATVQGLRASPFLENPALDSFTSIAAARGVAPIVQFQISGQVSSAPAPAVPGVRSSR